MRYSDDVLQSWTMPLSETESNRVEHTKNMVKDALEDRSTLVGLDFEVFAQGSYANNTNVRQNSDIDICVMLKSNFYGNYESGLNAADYGFFSGNIEFSDYKECVVEALRYKFGYSNVQVGNKCIDIKANSYHVNADIVPAFQYRDYGIIHSTNPEKFVEGIKFQAEDGTWIINYPKNHLENGRRKNKETSHRYKKLVRIMKHIRNEMDEACLIDGEVITSFLVECLVWNLPNAYIMRADRWNDLLRDAIAYLWRELENGEADQWYEVSEWLYLFHRQRKWNQDSAKVFLAVMYEYLGY